MNTYLKLDSELPAGPAYLKLSDISLPAAVANLGHFENAFKLKAGVADLTGAATNVVGTIAESADGAYIGTSGYIDTLKKETPEFTWIVLAKVSDNGAYAPLITSYVDKTLASNGIGKGTTLGVRNSVVKFSDSTDPTTVFTAQVTVGKWMLALISKKAITGGSQWNIAVQTNGGALQKYTSTPVNTAAPNTENNVCVGWSPKMGGVAAHSTLFDFASTHNVGLNASEVQALMTSLTAELNQLGFAL